ncbi:hypothetical protein, partial [Aeromonas dhakensis]|uniref:hypothetical protein n=1 Tax=Aeromonas dhakensis TaxID=196024 RepID=UPI001C868EE2
METDIDSISSHNENGSEDNSGIIKALTDELQSTRSAYTTSLQRIAEISFEINDSQLFVESLSQRVRALKETQNTINALSDISFNHCPACQTQIVKKNTGCSLCGTHKNDAHLQVDPTFK